MNRQRVNPLYSGIGTIVVVLALMLAVVISGLPGGPPIPGFPHGTAYKVLVADTDGLQPRAAVQIAGVKVGEVRTVELQGDQALVTMDIQQQYADIHTDAVVLLRPHGLFGPKFIDLSPGNASAPVQPVDQPLTVAHAVQPVDLDQVLHELQKPEQDQLKTVLVELGKAAEGRGDDVNHLLAAAHSLTQVLDSPVQGLDSVAPNLSDFLVQNEAFNASFAQAPLDQWVANSNVALGAFAENSDHLASILVHANNTLNNLEAAIHGRSQNLRTTIEQLPATIDKLDRLQDLLGLFAANFTGKEPGTKDVTQGIIGAIENIRLSFIGSDPCTPGQGTCPADGQSHYVRQQAFNVTPNNPLTPLSCQFINTPIIGSLIPCTPAAAGVDPSSVNAVLAGSDASMFGAITP